MLLERIADALYDLLSYDTLTIYEADESNRVLRPVLARDAFADEIMDSIVPFGVGITGWAVKNRQPVLSNEAHTDPRVQFVPGTPIEPEALISVPLLARGQIKGALNLYRQNDRVFTHDEFRLAKVFSEAAALAIDNANVRSALEHQAQTDPLTGLYNHRFFHERLRSEISRASRAHDSVALLMFDIDDFKKLNDVHGHGLGDQVLLSVAEILRSTIRASDVACRIGGEEFAVILPSCDAGDALGLARRLRDRLAVMEMPPAGSITVSTGIAQGPEHAMNPRELVSCAEAAMMAAKARGKDRSVLFGGDALERPEVAGSRNDVRSIAHLKMLQSLAGKLNRLNDVKQIAETIADELRTLIDYHSCRIYVAEDVELTPIAVRGDLAAYGEISSGALATKIGEGVTGRAAESGRSLLIPNALECDFAVTVPGTDEIEESLLCVPMMYGARVNGVITVSKLGSDQFDTDDLRLVEVLSGQASVALENARLYEAQRREAENANALLRFADKLSNVFNTYEIANMAVQEMTAIMGVPQASIWLLADEDGTYKCAAHQGYASDPGALTFIRRSIGRQEANEILAEGREPFVLTPEEMRARFEDLPPGPLRTVAIAPLAGDAVSGWLVARQGKTDAAYFTDDKLRLLAGIAYQVTVAIQKATLYKDQKETADVASAMLELSSELSSAETLDEILDRVVEQAARILGSPRTWVWWQEANDGDIVPAAWWGVEEEEVERFRGLRFSSDLLGQFFDGVIEPFVLQASDYRHLLDGALVDELAYAVAPMKLDNRFGCIVVAAPALGEYRFSERKMRLLAGLADQAKMALTNASNFEILETTFLSTIEALANALEAKDEYTSNHTRSIVETSRDVGIAMGLDATALKHLEMGALFHDIGKIGIPSDLLRKEGPLTDQERAIMAQHPELGEKILAPIERLADVRPIVRACHEHFDGSGYPDGKAGDEILVQSRIILVCDAFDAMTSDRPYRSRLPIDEARRRLAAGAGHQFDPDVVEIFLRLLDAKDAGS